MGRGEFDSKLFRKPDLSTAQMGAIKLCLTAKFDQKGGIYR